MGDNGHPFSPIPHDVTEYALLLEKLCGILSSWLSENKIRSAMYPGCSCVCDKKNG